ncbi:MAG: hypothetical protein ABSC53_13730 [Bacteroidota bacterium]|jgi:hypothetical protein
MKDKITINEGVWFNFDMVKCKVRITRGDNYPLKNHYDVWFEDKQDLLCVFVGKYASEYEAMHMIEKIAGQKVYWRIAA